MTGRVAGLVLAAGGGRRFGRPKALVRFEGQTLVGRACSELATAGCVPVVAVLGADARTVEAGVPSAETVHNPDWDRGLGSSLRAGLAALRGRADAAVVLLADQPRIGAGAVRRVTAAWTGDVGAVAATYGDRPGHPVLLAASVWDEVAAAAGGDVGARAWLREHPDRVVHVACDDVADPVDIDTPADLDALSTHPDG